MGTLEELKVIVDDYKGEDVKLAAETTFDEIGFDSLDKVDLMMRVEEKFGIEIGEQTVVNTAGELVAAIDALRK